VRTAHAASIDTSKLASRLRLRCDGDHKNALLKVSSTSLVPCDALENRTRFTHRSASVIIRHHAEGAHDGSALGAVAVDLDLMQPSGTIGCTIPQGRIARRDEPGEWRALRAGNAGGRLAVTRTPQRDGTHADLIGLGPSEFHDRANSARSIRATQPVPFFRSCRDMSTVAKSRRLDRRCRRMCAQSGTMIRMRPTFAKDPSAMQERVTDELTDDQTGKTRIPRQTRRKPRRSWPPESA